MSLNLFIWGLKKLRLIRQTAREPSIYTKSKREQYLLGQVAVRCMLSAGLKFSKLLTHLGALNSTMAYL